MADGRSGWASANVTGKRAVVALLLLVVAGLKLFVPGSALAHAYLVHADPPPGSTLAQAPTQLRLTFSEPVDSLTSQLLANWSIPGLQIFSASRDDVRRDRVSLRTSRQAPTTVYTVTATGIRDVSQAGNVMGTGSKSFTSWGFGGLGAGSLNTASARTDYVSYTAWCVWASQSCNLSQCLSAWTAQTLSLKRTPSSSGRPSGENSQ